MAQMNRVPSGLMFDPILRMVSSFSALGSVCLEVVTPFCLLVSSPGRQWVPRRGSGNLGSCPAPEQFPPVAVGLSSPVCSFTLPSASPHGVTSPCHWEVPAGAPCSESAFLPISL